MKRWFVLALIAGLATLPFFKRKMGSKTPVIALAPDLRYDIEDYLGDQL